MTIQEALQQAKQRISPVSDSANLDAQILLCAVLEVERSYLLAHPEAELTPAQLAHIEALTARRAAGEPVAYILGRRAFYDRDLLVAPGVLIPRPETELLLEQALAFIAAQPQAKVVDVGTGSGALAVTLAANCPQVQVYATDISPNALMIARQNAAQQSANVTFYEGDLLQPLIERGLKVDVVMANLPYIATDELPELAVSRYEPLLALDGGPDGLDIIRRLLNAIPQVEPKLVLLEIGADQGAAALALAQARLQPREATVIQDYAGLDRIVRVEL
ncbi:MAG: peptide chain release factor N(5)-glutamine methyltransferase [Anaerolineae bacterium]|nr:peptide chain release factor N(5)-glutamine methyltransferase [Anaerolineae bacterium]